MYYIITKEQAELIGEFGANGISFSPFTTPQPGNTYAVSHNMYRFMKDTDQFKQIDWEFLTKVSELTPPDDIVLKLGS